MSIINYVFCCASISLKKKKKKFEIEGFVGVNTLHKTVSTTFFLYFACILPAIALGVLNYNNTNGEIGAFFFSSVFFYDLKIKIIDCSSSKFNSLFILY